MNTQERINALTDIGFENINGSCQFKDLIINSTELQYVDDATFDAYLTSVKKRIAEYPEYYQVNLPQQSTEVPATTQQQPKQEEDKEVVMFQQSISVFQTAPGILKTNKNSVVAAKAAGQLLLDKVAGNGNKMTAELDEEAKKFIIKIGTTISSMKKQREPFTQLAAALSKQFTTAEAELDVSKPGNVVNKLQALRDGWAKFCIEEAERKKREADEKADIDKQKGALHGWVIAKIGELLANYLFQQKQNWNNHFATITLADFDERSSKLQAAKTDFNINHKLQIVMQYILPKQNFPKLQESDVLSAERQAHDEYDFNTWIDNYNREMAELKQSLVDRLPSKKDELREQARLQEERRLEEEKQRKAEEERQKQLRAEKDEKKKKEMEEQQRRDREAEQEKLRKLEDDRKRQEQEKQQREREEQEKLQREKEESERKAKEVGDMAGASMHAASLFDQAAAVSETPAAPETRSGYEIEVSHPAGLVELFQFWYNKEGVKMSVTDALKKSLGQMKKFAEDTAKKTGEKIESKYLTYNSSVKAVNRKEKTAA